VTSPSKRKGSKYELDLVKEFRRLGFEAERCYGAGRPDDVGDLELTGIPLVVEAKACARFDLAGWVDEARTEARNAGVDVGVVIVKAPRKPIADSYVVMRLPEFADLAYAYAQFCAPKGARNLQDGSVA
jgi:hypothetical protein